MGVPKFFRWLTERYPSLIEPLKEWRTPDFDNLYLDLNGIIHNCSHPDDFDIKFRIKEKDVFLDIFFYIEYVFNLIKPKKILFIAVDGVAPRAKMNHQRARRFRNIKEMKEKEENAKKEGIILPETSSFDSNSISPGTEFMDKLQQQLNYFVVKKISTDPSWKNIKVYLSGHQTPGEGEHKIMDFIRYQKAQKNHDPYTKHCMYGLDADLFILGLSTHEPFFSILREEVVFAPTKSSKNNPQNILFFLFHLSMLRDYISLEFSFIKKHNPHIYDLENIIDDWIFLTTLIGNDFLPNLPGFDISKSGFDLLYLVYNENFEKIGGYITEKGKINMDKLKKFFSKLHDLDYLNYLSELKEFKDKYMITNIIEKKKTIQQTKIELIKSYPATLDSFRQHKLSYYMKKMKLKHDDVKRFKKLTNDYIKTLQWNLYYYFDGCQSWKWYYPEHYNLYVSDLNYSDDNTYTFELDEPYLPFEQLFTILPKESMRFLPKPFQDILETEKKLKPFFPDNLEVDLNNKKNAWEAVVLLPFLDEQIIKSVCEKVSSLLTDEEKKLNTIQPHLLYTYSEQVLQPYKSILPEHFNDIVENRAKCEFISHNQFWLSVSNLKKGLSKVLKSNPLYNYFPSLEFIQFEYCLKKLGLRVFLSPSRNESLIIYIKDKKVKNNWNEFIGKKVFFDWPYLKDGKLAQVYGNEYIYYLKKKDKSEFIAKKKHDSITYANTIKKVESLINYYKNKRGIIFENNPILVSILPLIGVSYVPDKNGKLIKTQHYSNKEVECLASLLVKELKTNESEKSSNINFNDFYNVGSKCFVLHPEFYGDEGEILSINLKMNSVSIQFTASFEPDLSELKSKENEYFEMEYQSMKNLCYKVDLSENCLKALLGQIYCFDNDGHKINIGLNLRNNYYKQDVIDYSRFKNGKWFFSNKVPQLIEEYKKRYPFIIEGISKNVYGKDNYKFELYELIPFDNTDDILKDLKLWIQNLPFAGKQKNFNDLQLDSNIVKAIEDVVEYWNVFGNEPVSQIKTFKLNEIFVPFDGALNLCPKTDFDFTVYDRVVFIKKCHSISLGQKGFVIGKKISEPFFSQAMLTVMFDTEFENGIANFSKKKKVLEVPSSFFLNISQGKKIDNHALDPKFKCDLPKAGNQMHLLKKKSNYWEQIEVKKNFTNNSEKNLNVNEIKIDSINKKSNFFNNGLEDYKNGFKENNSFLKSPKNNLKEFLLTSKEFKNGIKELKNNKKDKIINKEFKNDMKKNKYDIKEQKVNKIIKHKNNDVCYPISNETSNSKNESSSSIESQIQSSDYYKLMLQAYCLKIGSQEPIFLFDENQTQKLTAKVKFFVQDKQILQSIELPKANYDLNSAFEKVAKKALKRLNIYITLPPSFVFLDNVKKAVHLEIPKPPDQWIFNNLK